MKLRIIFSVSLLLSALLTSASPEIYKWKDSKGNVIFTDSPPAGVEAEEKQLREDRIERPEVKEETPKPKRAASVTAPAEKRPYKEINVVMYMTSWCPYCRKAREFINSLEVTLTEYDREKDKGKNREMLDKSGGKGVPLIDVEGILIRGYTPDAIREAVERRRGL